MSNGLENTNDNKQSSFKKYVDIFVLKNPFQNHLNYSKNIKKIFEELRKT